MKKPSRALGIRFRTSSRRPLLVVAVSVNGRGPFDFVLDTGASFSVITPATAKAARVQASEDSPTAIGAGGPIEARLATLKSLRVGRHTVKGLPVAVMTLAQIEKPLGFRVGGLIGYNFLQNFIVTIDYPARRLFLKPSAKKRSQVRKAVVV